MNKWRKAINCAKTAMFVTSSNYILYAFSQTVGEIVFILISLPVLVNQILSFYWWRLTSLPTWKSGRYLHLYYQRSLCGNSSSQWCWCTHTKNKALKMKLPKFYWYRTVTWNIAFFTFLMSCLRQHCHVLYMHCNGVMYSVTSF